MAKFSILTIEPPNYIHVRAFDELKILVYHSLRHLGHDLDVATNRFDSSAINIVFGGHLLEPRDCEHIPPGSIIFNTEQLHGDYHHWRDRIAVLAAHHHIWDYSSRNLAYLRDNVHFGEGEYARVRIRLGYHQALTRIHTPRSSEEGLSFFGSVTEMRKQILDTIGANDALSVRTFFGIYGWRRDSIMARSKAVLNIHSQASRILEWPRILYLVANEISCLALTTPQTASEDDQLSYVIPVDESDPVPDLLNHLESEQRLLAHAAEALERIKDQRQENFTQVALDQTFADRDRVKPSDTPPMSDLGSSEIDQQWYAFMYPEAYADPRGLELFHHEVGHDRQWHPNPGFASCFRAPILVPARPGASPAVPDRWCVVVRAASFDQLKVLILDYAPFFDVTTHFYFSVASLNLQSDVYSLASAVGLKNYHCAVDPDENGLLDAFYASRPHLLGSFDLCLFVDAEANSSIALMDQCSILAGSRDRLSAIEHLFASQPTLGMVFPDYHASEVPRVGWGDSRALVELLLSMLGGSTQTIPVLEYPFSSCFWARPQAMTVACMLYQSISTGDLGPGLSDAFLRLPCLACEMSGLNWQKLARH